MSRRGRAALALITAVGCLMVTAAALAAPAVNYGAHDGPVSVAVADLNGDGRPDLAVANESSGDVSVLLGRGDGSFRPRVDYRAGRDPTSMAVGDLNGDGRPDLAVLSHHAGEVSVLLGRGDGSFGPPAPYRVGRAPWSVATGDLNGDGRLDLAVAGEGGPKAQGDVCVLLGNGDGSFQPPIVFGAFGQHVGADGVAVGDLSGDGRADLAVATEGSNDVLLLLGNGDGSFQPPQPPVDYLVGLAPISPVVGDLNGDGRPDLVTSNFSSNDVSVLLGRGDGSFQLEVAYRVGFAPLAVAVGDLSGDGLPDVAAANGDSRNVSVLLGAGDGALRPAVNYSTGDRPDDVALGDLNGDGRLDLATANNFTNDVSVLLNTGFHPLKVTVTGVTYGRCLRGPVRVHVLVTGAPSLRSVEVTLDKKRIAHTRRARFSVTLRPRPPHHLHHPHSLVVVARDNQGGEADKLIHIFACGGRPAR